MSYTVVKEANELVIRVPLSELPDSLKNVLEYLDYAALGEKSKLSRLDVREMVEESKGKWWAANKERFRDVPGFERFF